MFLPFFSLTNISLPWRLTQPLFAHVHPSLVSNVEPIMDKHDINKDEGQDQETTPTLLCTYAVTGPVPTFQEIFICHTCCQKPKTQSQSNLSPEIKTGGEMPLCICEGCAEACHMGHNVEYMGTGPSYCDCHTMGEKLGSNGLTVAGAEAGNNSSCNDNRCKIKKISIASVLKLGMTSNSHKKESSNFSGNRSVNISMPLREPLLPSKEIRFPYLCATFDIVSLRQSREAYSSSSSSSSSSDQYDPLVIQSLELVKHTRDTHWIPASVAKGINIGFGEDGDLCELEILALSIFNRHIIAYKLDDMISEEGGAEWWIQVKKEDDTNDESGIDLHYDKDEELASMFNIGSFPTLSTVTYLASGDQRNIPSNPTLVFAHTYEMPNDGPIGAENVRTPQVLISSANVGKHLVFDGRLLHGAPCTTTLRSNKILRNTTSNGEMKEDSSSVEVETKGNRYRITFLVNIWLSGCPARVKTLPSSIRSNIKSSVVNNSSELIPPCEFVEREIELISIEDDNISEEILTKEVISLPFVSSGATWIGEDDSNYDEGLVVKMFPPPQNDSNTALILYPDGFEPTLEYLNVDEDNVWDEE